MCQRVEGNPITGLLLYLEQDSKLTHYQPFQSLSTCPSTVISDIVPIAGPGHCMECKALFSMEVKAAIPWSCYVFNSMEFHGIAGLTVRKCIAVDTMEKFHPIAGLTIGI